ncbi:hypothetical protein EBS80_03140, partial [bacterium]|nr:hypothetical protein [bacterium]
MSRYGSSLRRAGSRFGYAGLLAVAFALVFGSSVFAQFARQTGAVGEFGTGYGNGYGTGYGWDGGDDYGYRYGFTGTYTVSSTTYDPYVMDGDATQIDPEDFGDDTVLGPYEIPFYFQFYGNYYDSLSISSNGFVTFSNDDDDGCCEGQVIPDMYSPNNLIAGSWSDYVYADDPEATVSYETFGSAPNRVFVIDFSDVAYISGDDSSTFQIWLKESDDSVEIHETHMDASMNDFDYVTVGVENASGTDATAVPGYNATSGGVLNEAAYLFEYTPGSRVATYTVDSPDEWGYGFGYGYLIDDGEGNSSWNSEESAFDIPSESIDQLVMAGIASVDYFVEESRYMTFSEEVWVTDGSHNEVDIDSGSTWTGAGGSVVDFGSLFMDSSVSTAGLSGTVRGKMEIGLPEDALEVTGGFGVYLHVSSALNGQELTVYQKQPGGEWEELTSCEVSDSFCSFPADSLGAFAATGGRVSGGGGGGSVVVYSQPVDDNGDDDSSSGSSGSSGSSDDTSTGDTTTGGSSGDETPSTEDLTPSSEGTTEDSEGRNVAEGSGETGPSPFDGATEDISTVRSGWFVRGYSSPVIYYVDTDNH